MIKERRVGIRLKNGVKKSKELKVKIMVDWEVCCL